jgi:hypothetical protein
MNLSKNRIGANIFVSDVEYHSHKYPAHYAVETIRRMIADRVAEKIVEEYTRDPQYAETRITAEVYVFTESELVALFRNWEKEFCKKYNFANPVIFGDEV